MFASQFQIFQPWNIITCFSCDSMEQVKTYQRSRVKILSSFSLGFTFTHLHTVTATCSYMHTETNRMSSPLQKMSWPINGSLWCYTEGPKVLDTLAQIGMPCLHTDEWLTVTFTSPEVRITKLCSFPEPHRLMANWNFEIKKTQKLSQKGPFLSVRQFEKVHLW